MCRDMALVTFQSVKFLRAWILVEATAWGENLFLLAGVGTIPYLPYLPLGDSTKCMVSVALLGLGGTADTPSPCCMYSSPRVLSV